MRTGEIEAKTFAHYEYLLRCHLLPALHRYRLTDLTYRVVDEFKKRKVDEMRRIQAATKAGVTLRHANGRPMKLSPKTINHAIDLLSAILGAAARDDELDIKVNPADDRRLRVKIPKRSARDFLEADEVLSLLVAGEVVDNRVKPATIRAAEEVRRLRDEERLPWKQIAARLGRSEAGVIWLHRRRAVRGPSQRRAVVALLAASGARNTEACDLRWSDLDFTHGKINVSRSKTKRGVREIDMIPWLQEELLTYRAALGIPDLDVPVFPTRDGFHRTKDNLNRNVIRPVVRAANDARRERSMPAAAGRRHRPHVPQDLRDADARGRRTAHLRPGPGRPRGREDDAEDLRARPAPAAGRARRSRVQRADVRGAGTRVSH